MDPGTLRTPRLVLRPPALDDVDAIAAACRDPAIQRYVPVPVPYAREDAISYVSGFCADGWASGDRLTWAVLAGGGLVGTVGLHAITAGFAARFAARWIHAHDWLVASTVLVIEPKVMEAEAHAVFRVARCGTCGPRPYAGVASPWRA